MNCFSHLYQQRLQAAIYKVGKLLNVLQSGVVYFAGADLDHLGHIVNKDLAITDMAGVQNLGGGVDDLVYRDLADNNRTQSIVSGVSGEKSSPVSSFISRMPACL